MSDMNVAIIDTIEALVDAMGGRDEVARWAKINPTGVSNWIARGIIPPGWHLRLLVEIRRRRLVVDFAALFELSEDDAQFLQSEFNGGSRRGHRGPNRISLLA